MGSTTNQKVSISLPPALLRYADAYQQAHGLPSRSEVLALALKALRERELAQGYRALADEYKTRPDPLVDAGVAEGLEPSSEENW